MRCMEPTIDLSQTRLTEEEKEGVLTFCRSMGERLGDGLLSVSLYGSALTGAYAPGRSDINLLVVVERVDLKILRDLLAPVNDGRRFGISPFIITSANLETATEVFPVKFRAIMEGYQLLVGKDPLEGVRIDDDLLCLRCRQELVNILLRMRMYYLRRGGRDLTAHMANIAPALLENVRAAVSLGTEGLPPRETAIGLAAQRFGIDAQVLHELADLRQREVSLPPEESDLLFDRTLRTVDRLIRALDEASTA